MGFKKISLTMILLISLVLVTAFVPTTKIYNLSGWEEKENTIQTLTNKTVNITGTLVVQNITSPFSNKSNIQFFSDGSVGIGLDPK